MRTVALAHMVQTDRGRRANAKPRPLPFLLAYAEVIGDATADGGDGKGARRRGDGVGLLGTSTGGGRASATALAVGGTGWTSAGTATATADADGGSGAISVEAVSVPSSELTPQLITSITAQGAANVDGQTDGAAENSTAARPPAFQPTDATVAYGGSPCPLPAPLMRCAERQSRD